MFLKFITNLFRVIVIITIFKLFITINVITNFVQFVWDLIAFEVIVAN